MPGMASVGVCCKWGIAAMIEENTDCIYGLNGLFDWVASVVVQELGMWRTSGTWY